MTEEKSQYPAAGRLQTSRSLSTFAGREEDRGNAKLHRRWRRDKEFTGRGRFGLEERWEGKGGEKESCGDAKLWREKASLALLGNPMSGQGRGRLGGGGWHQRDAEGSEGRVRRDRRNQALQRYLDSTISLGT